MIIVIIHWRIHPNNVSRADFFEYWKKNLEIEDKTNLVGEFLSKPLSASEANFACLTMNSEASDDYESFFNIGIWKDLASFEKEIIKPFVGDKSTIEAFEYQYRERMILEPQSRRIGNFNLPEDDKFAS